MSNNYFNFTFKIHFQHPFNFDFITLLDPHLLQSELFNFLQMETLEFLFHYFLKIYFNNNQ